MMDSGMAAQFSAMNLLFRRSLSRQMDVATISFPVPLSPVIRTVDVLLATWLISSFSFNVAGLEPMMLVLSTAGSTAVSKYRSLISLLR